MSYKLAGRFRPALLFFNCFYFIDINFYCIFVIKRNIMNDKELSDKLKQKAISLGLCKEWTNGWGNPDKYELCEKYIRGIDFCLFNRFPSNEIIKKEFAGVREKFNIFVDDTNLFISNPKWSIFNGSCDCVVTFNDFGIGEMYVKDNSRVSLVALDNSIVHVSLIDDAKLDIVSSKYTRVFVYTNTPKNISKVDVKGKLMIKPFKLV